MVLDINFNFNSGDYYGESSSIKDVLIPVGTVLLTIIAQRIYDNLRSNEALDDLYSLMKIQANKIGLAAVKQADSLANLSRVLKRKEIMDFSISKVTAFNMEQIKNWETLDFYLSIVSRRKAKKEERSELIELHSKIKFSFNYFKQVEKIIDRCFDELNEKYQRAQNEWKLHVQSIGDLLDLFRIGALQGDTFLHSYDQIVHDWNTNTPENTKREMSVVYEGLVLPLNALCKLYPQDVRAYQLQREILSLKGAYQEMVHLKSRYRAWFIKTARALVKANIEFQQRFTEVEKFKLKCKFHL